MGVRVSQPLRVSSGGLNLDLPVAYDYTTESPIFGAQRINLAPEGREVMGELMWRSPMWLGPFSGQAGASLFYRHNPGHFAAQPADTGAVVTFSADF